MYGLLLEGIRCYITDRYSTEIWNTILTKADVKIQSFSSQEIYSDGIMERIIEAAVSTLHLSVDDIMFANGQFFITFLAQFGYDVVLRVLGRDLRDFLNGLDNLHEYLRFTYRRLKPPSFFCVNESKTGITLQYRTKRRGFAHYVRGQITEIARLLYKTEMQIEIVTQSVESSGILNCILRLHFNNHKFQSDDDTLQLPAEVFFQVFPFNIIFNRGMKILNIGKGLFNALPHLVGSNINTSFMLTRPFIDFTWDAVMIHTNNVFEISASVNSKGNESTLDRPEQRRSESALSEMPYYSGKDTPDKKNIRHLKLKGQMKYMPAWDAMVFLGTPVIRDVENMYSVGLYINDLSMHDSSRDLILAGEQQSAELKLAIEQEQEKSAKLEESMKKLDEEKKKADQLLYQMIPKTVADRLRKGESAIDTCEIFNEVTILFSDVVGFTNICSAITPLQVVNMLNGMYSLFDEMTEKHGVYKVETIGDAYMIVSGAPEKTDLHAPLICEMGMDMVRSVIQCKDPSGISPHLSMRIGIHTGMVVAGVVGVKMPRYCLFGESVNTANMLESTGKPQHVHISATTKNKLDNDGIYKTHEDTDLILTRGNTLGTYFLVGYINPNSAKHSEYMTSLQAERDRLKQCLITCTSRTDMPDHQLWHEWSSTSKFSNHNGNGSRPASRSSSQNSNANSRSRKQKALNNVSHPQ